MRIIAILMCLVLSACAGSGGVKTTALEPTLFERFGTITTQDVTDLQLCSDHQVNWCSNQRGQKSCQCIHVQEAKTRTRRMADMLSRPNY